MLSLKTFAAFALTLLLAACGGGDGFGLPGAPRTTAPTGVTGTTVPGLALSETGIGAVNQSTAFSSSALSQALNGARVERVSATFEGRVISQLAAFGPSGLQMARFQGASGRVSAAQIVSEDIPGPRGERVGMSYRQAGGNAMRCREGTGSWSQMALCSRGGSAISYLFSVPLWTEGRMPRGSELDAAILNRMIWEP